MMGENTRPPGEVDKNRFKMTKEQLEQFLPKGSRAKVTDKILEILNNVEDDGIDQGYMREKVISFAEVLKDGYPIEDYLKAIKYNIAVANGVTNRNAYMMVHPERTAEIERKAKIREEEIAKGLAKSPIDLDNYVAMYNKGDLIVEIKARMALDVAIMNQPVNAEALNVKINLMRGIAAPDPSGKAQRVTPLVQLQAAQAVFAATEMPKDNTIQLKVGYDEQALEVQKGISEQLRLMAEAQMQNFKAGKSLTEVQKLNVQYEEAEIVDD